MNDDDRKERPGFGPIGVNADGTVNVVPPEKLDEVIAELRRQRIEEGWTEEDFADNTSAGWMDR